MKKSVAILLFLFGFLTNQAQCWQKVYSKGNFCLAIQSDGTLWGWGVNTSGELGDGTEVNRIIPTQSGTSNDWAMVGCGYNHTIAVRTNGTLWAWGFNDYGELGDNTFITRSNAVQIDTDTNWIQVDAGGSFSMGIKSDGTRWAWGNNFFNQFGSGTTTDSFIPDGADFSTVR